ncbi:hypothetical protein D3C78_1826700 [compost metagenome]
MSAKDHQQRADNSGNAPGHDGFHVAKYHVGFLCFELDNPDKAEPEHNQHPGDQLIRFQVGP